MQSDSAADFHFSINSIQTVTFPLPSDYLTFDKNRRFFVFVSDGLVMKETRAAVLDRQSLHWGEILDGFIVNPSSYLTLKIFEKHEVRKNNLLATFTIPYETLHSSRDVLVRCIDNSKKQKSPSREIKATWSEHCFTLTEAETEPDGTVNKSIPTLSIANMIEDSHYHVQEARHDAGQMKGVSGRTGVVMDTYDEIVGNGYRAVTAVTDNFNKWESVLDRLQFVVRAVDTIAEIHPYANLAWNVLSYIPKKISEQAALDHDVQDLLDAIEQALDLASDADMLRTLCKQSANHEKTIVHLLDQISKCGCFIQSYVKDANFWTRSIKNFGSNTKKVVEDYRQTLKKLHDDLLGESIVNVEINVSHILVEVESINKSIKELDLDMKLQQLPYGKGTRFNPEKCCLPGTRSKFIEAITTWVNDSNSLFKVLLLFGQAGTGKSSIAHHIAYRFQEKNLLTTSYCFVRGQPSSWESYRFFTTLVTDLCNKYPAFKFSLGDIIAND